MRVQRQGVERLLPYSPSESQCQCQVQLCFALLLFSKLTPKGYVLFRIHFVRLGYLARLKRAGASFGSLCATVDTGTVSRDTKMGRVCPSGTHGAGGGAGGSGEGSFHHRALEKIVKIIT